MTVTYEKKVVRVDVTTKIKNNKYVYFSTYEVVTLLDDTVI